MSARTPSGWPIDQPAWLSARTHIKVSANASAISKTSPLTATSAVGDLFELELSMKDPPLRWQDRLTVTHLGAATGVADEADKLNDTASGQKHERERPVVVKWYAALPDRVELTIAR